MIIILEGPDGSGKSTLAAKLAKQNNYKMIHHVAPENDRERELQFHMYMKELNSRVNLILDRAWYSDMVYGPVYRGEATIQHHQMFALEERMAKVGGLLIYCTDTLATLWNRCQERGEDNPGSDQKFEEDYEKFSQVWHGYERLMSIPHHIPVVRYEFKDL